MFRICYITSFSLIKKQILNCEKKSYRNSKMSDGITDDFINLRECGTAV